jgi:hypothetical protein
MRGQKVWDWKAGIGVYGTFWHEEWLESFIQNVLFRFIFFKKKIRE